jgi:hypothetical protein
MNLSTNFVEVLFYVAKYQSGDNVIFFFVK